MLVLLDNGHGGIIDGVYQTPGKRSPIWEDGSQLFEGEFNRAIVNGIIEDLTRLNIDYVNIAPEYRDVTLQTRVNRANKYPKDSFYLSIHSNAGEGRGFEAFTSYRQTLSDKIAEEFYNAFRNEFPNELARTDYQSDGDQDKEVNFYVLRKTHMPAVLTENFFMDNEEECKKYLMTRDGRNRIIRFHVEAITRIQSNYFK